MKLTVDRKALAAAIKTASLPPTTGGLAILHGLRLDALEGKGAGAGKLTVTGTNLGLTIGTDIDADVAGAGTVILPGKLLGSLIDKATADTVTVSLDGDLATLEVGGVATLRTLRLDDWPKVTTADGERFDFTALDVDRVSRVLHAVSSNTARPVLTGVYFNGSQVWATDSYRLAAANLGFDTLPGKIVPGDTVKRVVRDAASGFLVTFDDTSVTFDSPDGRTTWTSRLIVGDYPNTEQLLRKDSPRRLVVGREVLMEQLRWVRLVVDDNEDRPVTMRAEGDRLHVRASAVGVGDAASSVACAGDFTDSFTVHSRYLLEALAEVGDDDVTFEVVDSIKPAQMRTSDWQLVLLLMPIRVGV
jgi:DNA polymerase-3 subunit beta